MKLLPLLFALSWGVPPADYNVDYDTTYAAVSENCDDFNAVDGDGCNANLHVELGWNCYNANTGFGSYCVLTCGDGIDDKLNSYACDDGNLLNGDGCDSACLIEAGTAFTCVDGTVGLPWVPYTCTENCDDDDRGTLDCDDSTNTCCNSCAIESSGVWKYNKIDQSCKEICGNGIMVTGSTKECEDGAANAGNEYFGDGCDWRCYLEDTTQPGPPYANFIWQDSWTQSNAAAVTSLTDDAGTTYTYNQDVFTEMVSDRYYDFYNYECQDDNVATGDGCDASMEIEDGWECWSGNPIGPDECYEICSDGKDYYDWWCEDHNLESGDGCSDICMIERGYDCVGGDATNVDICTEICADGIDYHTYDCDDGNDIDGDGCTADCELEDGWKCIDGDFDRADMCIEICGDGLRILDDGSCDDGDIFDGNGCSSVCDVETGWECDGGSSTSRDICWETCADGINAGGVECDDGNTRNGDGCTKTCTVEDGYYCEGGDIVNPDTCYEICGDSKNMGVNECDDGDEDDGDGCSSTCEVEDGWYCFDGTTTNRDTCRLNPQPSIISAVLSEDNSMVTLVFNTTMLLHEDWIKTDLKLYVHGPKDQYKVNWVLEDSDYLKTTAVSEYVISVDLEDQIYEGVEQYLVVDFTNVTLYQGEKEFRPLLNETAWMELNVQENQSNKYCNSSGLLYVVLGLLALFAVFSIFTAIFAGMSLFPLIYLVTSVQYLQVTPLMDLLFPTCLKTFFWQLRFLNFQGEFIYKALNMSNPEEPLNDNFKRHGYLSSEYFFNVMDILVLCAVFIVLLLVFVVVRRLMTDVVFMQSISNRYITNSIQDVIILIYFKHAIACFMYWEQRNIDNWFQFLSACLNILMTTVLLVGWPLVQVLMILKKNFMFWRLDREKQKKKAEKEAKKQDIFVQAEEHVEENKKKDPAVDNYLTFLQDPDGKHAEEEARKKAAEKKRKALENFTDSEEDEDYLAKKENFERKKMQKKFYSSYLFNCLWQDLNHHYNSKLFWYCLFAAKRIYFAKVLIDYREDGCTQIKQLLLLSILSLGFVVGFKPFKFRYYQQCAVNDEFWTTIACGTYFAFYHQNSGKYTVEYFSVIVMVSILAMTFFSFVFMIQEMILRLDPKYAEWAEPVIDEGEEPEKKQKKPKKEKKKKKKGDAPDIELVEAKRRQKEEEEKQRLLAADKSKTEEQSSYQSEDVTLSESSEEEQSSDEFDKSSRDDEIQAADIVADEDGETEFAQNQKVKLKGTL